ncbi:MAG: glycosyltransferase family 2 protein, partial [Thiothrix sp.]
MKQSVPELSIVLVSYNTAGYTRRALESLYRETQLTCFEVIVVDNASSDDSVAMLRQHFPQITLIESDKNLGFAGGVQLGAQRARGEYILLLNPDTVILNAAVDRLMDFAKQRPANGIWSGVTLNQDLSINTQHAWERPTLKNLLFSALGLSKLFKHS